MTFSRLKLPTVLCLLALAINCGNGTKSIDDVESDFETEFGRLVYEKNGFDSRSKRATAELEGLLSVPMSMSMVTTVRLDDKNRARRTTYSDHH